MRCLYCGKELALLKRLRGGGEFCSDAHRQQYRQEYDELALSRLLQAQPPASPKQEPEAEPVSEAEVSPVGGSAPSAQRSATPQATPKSPVPAAPNVPSTARPASPPAPPRVPAPEAESAVAVSAAPPAAPPESPKPKGEELKAPPELGFLVELPLGRDGSHEIRCEPLAMIESSVPVLPVRTNVVVDASASGQLPSAGRVILVLGRAAEHSVVPRGRGVEVREFAKHLPIVQVLSLIHI